MGLIERDKLLEDLKATGYNPDEYEEDSPGEAWAKGFNAGITHAIHDVIHTPEVEAAPVVHGEWINIDKSWHAATCSVCGTLFYKSKFCPDCGAKMDGKAV